MSEQLKLYLIRLEWRPADTDAEVVVAADEDAAVALADYTHSIYTRCCGDPAEYRRCNPDADGVLYSVTEVALDKPGVVYVGYNCC